jgi:ribosomal protein S18 acetylase RimI-like enzyme
VPDISVVRVLVGEETADCDLLFREYVAWSAGRITADGIADLSSSNLESVHAAFRAEWPKLFGPRGRLYLAKVDGQPAGVGALKPITGDTAEVKRMFVRSACRAMGLGRRIMQQLVDDARELGYRSLRLETMPFMTEAQSLYRSMGFEEVEQFSSEGEENGLAQCELFMMLEL